MFEIIQTETYKEAEKLYGKIIGKKRLARMFDDLEKSPTYGAKIRKIVGKELTYRYRIGDYRILYEVIENKVTVIMLTIKPRGNAYK